MGNNFNIHTNSLVSRIEEKITKSIITQPMSSLGGQYSNDWNAPRKPRANVRTFGGVAGLVGDSIIIGRSS